jgi:hypothetical protein
MIGSQKPAVALKTSNVKRIRKLAPMPNGSGRMAPPALDIHGYEASETTSQAAVQENACICPNPITDPTDLIWIGWQ